MTARARSILAALAVSVAVVGTPVTALASGNAFCQSQGSAHECVVELPGGHFAALGVDTHSGPYVVKA